MSITLRTFNSLPSALQSLAIELAITRARQDQYADLKNLVEQSVVAAGAALDVGAIPDLSVDPAKPGAEETVTQQVEAAGPNPDYVDPEIFDPKDNDNKLDALGYILEGLLKAAKPKKHCGRPECQACNAMFGEPEGEKKKPKARFRLFAVKDGSFGPVSIYRNEANLDVYAMVHRGKTSLVEVSDIELITYQAAVEIIRAHGKEDRSILG